MIDNPHHAIFLTAVLGSSQVVKAPVFDTGIRRFEPFLPSHCNIRDNAVASYAVLRHFMVIGQTDESIRRRKNEREEA